jgi:hypothetical protein
MPQRFSAFGWSIDLAPEWTATIHHECQFGETTPYLAIVPASNDVLLRLTPDNRGLISAARWVELVGDINRAMGRLVCPARCGDFSGLTMAFVSRDEYFRGWALCADAIPLDATYKCNVRDVGRDDLAIEGMLDTLRLDRS